MPYYYFIIIILFNFFKFLKKDFFFQKNKKCHKSTIEVVQTWNITQKLKDFFCGNLYEHSAKHCAAQKKHSHMGLVWNNISVNKNVKFEQ